MQIKKGLFRRIFEKLVLLFVLAIIGMTVTIFIVEKKQADRMSKRGKAETYSETFNTNFLPDYTVSADDVEKFNEKIIALLQKNDTGTINLSESGDTGLLPLLNKDEKIAKATSDMKLLKEYYPEGYYLVINSVLKTAEKEQIFQHFYFRSTGEADRVNFLVHELSHLSIIIQTSRRGDLGYLVEDKFINLNKLTNVPKGDELLKYISKPAPILDNKYLKKSKHDIYSTLEEIVSYTKSVRVARAFARYNKFVIEEDSTQGLSRQLYYLSLHLKNIKENHPNLWKTLKKEKGFAYLMSRIISIAKTEIQAAKDEGVSGFTGDNFASSIDDNLSLFNENQALFDELFTATEINSLGDLQKLTQKELAKMGIKIEKF